MRRRRGIVHIRQEVGVELPWHRFEASWQRDPADADSFEDGPGWNAVDEAVSWARRRAPRVHIRMADGYFAGGEHDWPRGEARWPGARRRRERGVEDRYSGVVYINEVRPIWWPREHYAASWESETGTHLGARTISHTGRGGFRDLERAIDWGRERAPVVLVALLDTADGSPPAYEIWSAGDEDPRGEELPRLRPLAPDETMEWEYANAIPASRALLGLGEVPRWKDPREALAALRADPRVTRATLDRERGTLRFRVNAASRTHASTLATEVFIDAALDVAENEEGAWFLWVGEVRPPRGRGGRHEA